MSKQNKRNKQQRLNNGNRNIVKRNGYNKRRKQHHDVFSIPQISNLPKFTRCMRYEGEITSSVYFTFYQLFLMIGSTRTSSSNYVSIFQSIKLNRIGVTCLPASATNAGLLTFEWGGDGTPHTQEIMAYSQGVPARGNFYPPEYSRASWWVEDSDATSTGDVAFTIDPSDSTVKVLIDIDFTAILANGSSTVTHTLTTAATFDGIAYLVLPTVTDELTPVGVSTVQ